MSDDMRIPGCGDDLAELPPESHALFRELLADGAAWRAGQPAMPRLDDTIAALMSQRDAARHTDTAVSTRATSSQGWYTDRNTKGTPPMQGKRLRGLAAAAVTLVVVALFGAVLLHTALTRVPSHSPGAASPTAVHGQWVEQSRLNEDSADSNPAIAPTDPSVVYETAQITNSDGAAIGGISLRGTADGGATWRDISPPTGIHTADLNSAYFFVSPLDAHTVFLWLADHAVPTCPASSSFTALSGTSHHGGILASGVGGPACLLVFVSTNSGSSWSQVNLPVPGVLAYGGSVGGQSLYAQGSRLYSNVYCTNVFCTRIVASDDGGRTWQSVDGAISASGQNICNYAVSPAGTTVFAVTATDQCKQQGQSAMYLWRSDDAGAHWSQVGALPQPFEHGMVATTNPSSGMPLLYMNMPTQIGTYRDKMGVIQPKLSDSPSDLKVSADGGRTWHAAPAQGAPANQSMYFGPYGILSDGSVIMPFVTNTGPSTDETLYTWKLGDPSWHKLAPAFPGNFIETLTVVSSPSQGDTLWATGHAAVQPVGTPAPTDGQGGVPTISGGGGYAVYVFRP